MMVRNIFSMYRAAPVVLILGTLLAALFVASYSIALGRPMPRHIPTAIIGNAQQRPTLIDALQQRLDGALEFHPYPSKAAAEAAMNQQTMKAALVLGTEPPRLLVSSAASAPVAGLLTSAVEQVGQQLAPNAPAPLHAVDIRPLPATDPQGLIGFYVTFAATILGFSMMFNLRAHEPKMPPLVWLAAIGVLAIVGGLVLTAITDLMIGALRGSFLSIWAAAAAQTAVTALATATMIVLFGRWAIVPAWLLFTAVGNPAAGGAVSAPILPALYAFFGHYLPTGATVAIIHNEAYFRDARHMQPVAVQAVWLVGSLAAFLISIQALHWKPTGGADEPADLSPRVR